MRSEIEVFPGVFSAVLLIFSKHFTLRDLKGSCSDYDLLCKQLKLNLLLEMAHHVAERLLFF